MIKPIYCFPGLGFDAVIFNELFESSEDFYGLNYFDLNLSSIEALAEHFSDYIPEGSCVLGWSFGALIAIKLAELFPSKVRKLILLSAQPKFIEDDKWQGIKAEDFQRFLKLESYDYFSRALSYPSRALSLRSKLKNYYVTEPFKFLELLRSVDLRLAFKKINVEILAIFGAQDAILPAYPEQLVRLNKHLKFYCIEGFGHLGFMLKPDLYRSLIFDKT